jgi:hypothetical protein
MLSPTQHSHEINVGFTEKIKAFLCFAFGDLSPKRLININLATQMAFSLFFSISSFFVAKIANAGLNVVLTGAANFLFASAAFYVVNKRQDAGSIGQVIGAGAVMVFLSLITAIYWGQLSRCQKVELSIRSYDCENKEAMRAVCAFAFFMFLLQVSRSSSNSEIAYIISLSQQLQFTVLLNNYKTHILAEAMQYAELPSAADSDDVDTDTLFTRHDTKSWHEKQYKSQSIIV